MPVSARSRGSGNAELLALDTVRGRLGNDGLWATVRAGQSSPRTRTVATRTILERRPASATLVPERQDLNSFRVGQQPVVDVIANSREVQAANAGQRNVQGAGPGFWLE